MQVVSQAWGWGSKEINSYSLPGGMLLLGSPVRKANNKRIKHVNVPGNDVL